jgi:pimeloyl-ACP methyl ester carboxylesterase
MTGNRKVYFLSGLGADRRMFISVRLPEGYEAVHLDWFRPDKGETLKAYAHRMNEGIKEENPIVAGLSFGGIMAQEIARIRPVSKLILLSTIKSRKEMPPLYKFGSLFKLQYLVGKWMLVFPRFISYYIFSVKAPAEKRLLNAVLDDIDPTFLHWAIRSTAKWNPPALNTPYYHIHGDSDRIFPLKYVKPDKVVEKGGHLIVMTHPRQVSQIIAGQL